MAAEMRDKPILTGENARRFIEREQAVDNKRKEMIAAGNISRVKRDFSLCVLSTKN